MWAKRLNVGKSSKCPKTLDQDCTCTCLYLIHENWFAIYLKTAPLEEKFHLPRVSRVEWLGSPVNIKGANKDAKIQVGKSMTMQNLLRCAHMLCMNYVTNMFLLVSSSVQSKQLLCFMHGQGQKSEQKPTTKNSVGFHNHSPL